MDVFSLLKFWRTTGGGGDFDSSTTAAGDFDDEDSFFDLVFTNSDDSVNFNSKRRILPLDSPNTVQSVKSPLRLSKLGFQKNQKLKLENETSSNEIGDIKIGALLKRDNSLRNKLKTEKLLEQEDKVSSKRFSKDVINKYLNLMKVSKRSTEKSRLSDTSITPSSSPASSVFSPRKDERKSGGRGAVFREVCKNLGKSRSSSAVLQTPARKSDDSALEQQDGIQRAILHCKRSYNLPSQDCLLRSGSAPSNNQARVSIEEQKRSSI